MIREMVCRRLVTILSIDGGGVRGVIPATILTFLESELQKLDGPGARLADYFDVIAGAGTGGLVASMLAAPNGEWRPVGAQEIRSFFLEKSNKIFRQSCGVFASIMKTFSALWQPRYSGKCLQNLLDEIFGPIRIQNMLTNVLIPTFDIKGLHATIFSSFEAKRNSSMNALLSDICLGTTAAPTYFPPHYFETMDSNGVAREFNLIDGGVTAYNPALLAIGEVIKEISREDQQSSTRETQESRKILVISLGTGSSHVTRYSANLASRWGIIGWLLARGSTPVVDMFTQASADMVDIHLSVVLQALPSGSTYLRIEDDTLSGSAVCADASSKQNLENLIKIAEKLLKKPVSRVNLVTGAYEPVDNGEGTNEEALRRFAKILSDERRRRHLMS